MSIFNRVLSFGEGKPLKQLQVLVNAVNAAEPGVVDLTDDELRAKTTEFRDRIANGATVADIEVEAFAVVREAAKRVLGQRHYDVQIVGAGALNRGMIAEMRTGEGKTLAGTMPAYANALTGRGVHIVTVNDYLAARDAQWMGRVHEFLGIKVGLIQGSMTPQERRPAYEADITHGTNNEFGFDYLRDNMAMRPENMVQRGHAYAIIDEVDSILIDEARTPLIISGIVGESGKWYKEFARIAKTLRRDVHYEVDEKKRQVITTEEGVHRVEEILGIENMYDFANVDMIQHLDVALKAKELYELDVDYLIKDGEVMIVDEFTGRVLEGRRYSEGQHQAIEAKEGVRVKEENQTLATITLQNYFRMYEKLAGMTGTAITEQGEFKEIYDLDVVVVPTNREIARADQPDLVYVNEDAKFDALVADIVARHAAQQPILVGTISIEKSELLSSYLDRNGVKHQVLNAKQHANEGVIVAQAGQPGSVTVATNMAGRGVDIQLGGNPEALAEQELRRQGVETDSEDYPALLATAIDRFTKETADKKQIVLDAGGLYVLGTERHDSRRIDNQLRGRSGRQGDVGESRFYLSLTDDLMRRFANERVASIMARLKIPPDVPIEASMVSKAIERAQTQVESQNFEIRKNVLKYDEVMNTQRKIIYEWRNQVLQDDDTKTLVDTWRQEVIEEEVLFIIQGVEPFDWDWEELQNNMAQLYPASLTRESFGDPEVLTEDDVVEAYLADSANAYKAREEELGTDLLHQLERSVILTVIDNKWRDHLAAMDYLRSGIGLRALAQRDPLVEYQHEAYDAFASLVDSVKRDGIRYVYHVKVEQRTQPQRPKNVQTSGPTTKRPTVRVKDKIGRNEPCHCGSGKKYKHCHGKPGAVA
ncbi:MAG: preprotein translocase subunit SecA [Actinobacteria bacterium]|nr:preprotein translocase subunit SecA [Actinomycetota bacterium]